MSRRSSSGSRDRVAAAVLVAQLTLACIFAFGCAGYHVGPVTKRNFNSIAVPVFRNATLHPQVEAQISNAVIQRLQQDGSLRVESEPRADVVLKGSITKYERQALRSLRTDTGSPREYEITITVRIESEPRADVVLKGSITKYSRQALRSLRTDTRSPREYEISIIVRVEATDRRTGETVLKSTNVEGKSDVFIGEDQQSAEEQVLPLIADDIGKRVAGLLVESWQ